MRYKTIILELIQQEYPSLHERLRANRTLLASLNSYAHTLRRRHGAWMYQLRQARPGSDHGQIPCEALELAIADLREVLLCESPPTDETEGLSLDAAMAFLHRATPPA